MLPQLMHNDPTRWAWLSSLRCAGEQCGPEVFHTWLQVTQVPRMESGVELGSTRLAASSVWLGPLTVC